MAKISINTDSLKSGSSWVRHKLKDGVNTFRFLPPFGQDHNGYPYHKWFVSWGLFDASGNKKPFASPKSFGDACPIFEYCDLLKKKIDGIEADLKVAGNTEEDIKATLKDLRDILGNLTPKSGFVYNAVDKAGEIGILELRSTAHKQLKDLFSEYINDYNQDPTSLNSEEFDSGVWINIIKSGKGFDTTYAVKKAQNKVKSPNGGITFSDDRSPLPEAVALEFENKAYDLKTVYQRKNYDDLKAILIANITILGQQYPELLIEGFYEENVPVQKAAPKVVAPKAPVLNKAAAPKIAINLGNDDDDEEGEQFSVSVTNNVGTVRGSTSNAPVRANTAAPARPNINNKKVTNDEDIMDMAARVFDNL